MSELDDLIQTAHILRSPGGCPWDAEQTHLSLVQYLVEETYELIDALETGNRDSVLEELGDVLYQVIFHSDLAETGSLGETFDIQDVARFTNQKMRGRHPHVFGDAEQLERFKATTGDEVMVNWESHKQKEKPERTSVLDGIPSSLPALALAHKILAKSEKISNISRPVSLDLEFKNQEELGDFLLNVVELARQQGLDPEQALRNSTRNLADEVRAIEAEAAR